MFRHLTKAGQYFQDAMHIYIADFMDNELVPDTKIGLWKDNMTRYIHEKKEWDA